MLRKLLFSVLVFSLVLAFTGTAFSGTPKVSTLGVDAKQPYAIKTDRDLAKATVDRPQNARTPSLTQEGVDMPYPSPYAPEHECEIADYTDYTGSYYGSWWYGTDTGYLLGVQFDVQEFHSAVVYGAAVRIYATGPTAPDMIFKVWDDAGGIPGAMLYTETVPGADLVTLGGGNWLFSFASSVDIPGTKYFITYEFNGAAEDSIRIGLNQNADGTDNGRSFASYDGGTNWITLTDLFGGFNLNLRLASDVCYVYSDCYWASSGLQYYIQIPYTDIGLTDGIWSGIGQEFEAINDTLKTATVIFYNRRIDAGGPVYLPTTQLNGCEVKVWDDDGAGNPDVGAGPLFTYTIPAGVANMFPVTGNVRANGVFEYHDIPVTGDLVFRGKFHITANMTGSDVADGQVNILIEDFAAGGSVAYNSTDSWESTFTNNSWVNEFWGNGNAFYFQAELCRDEYQECQHQVLYTGADWGTSFSLAYDADGDGDFDSPGGPDGNYDEVAQLVKARDENRLEHASFMVANNYWYSGLPIGNFEVVFRVYNVGGLQFDGVPGPGAVIWESDPIPISDASAWDAFGQLWVDVVIPDVLTFGDFFVGYKATNLGGTINSRLRAANDGDWGSGNVNGGGQLYYYPLADWVSCENFGYLDSWGWWIDVDFCSVPQPEWQCGAADWATNQHDFQRTGHGGVGVGDAKCTLTLNWAYMHPTGKYGQFTGPVISGNTIVGTFRGTNTEYKTFDLITKVEGYTITTAGNVTGMPTIYNGVMYVSGGTSAQIVQAYDFATGTLLWDIGTTDAEGIALGMGASEVNTYGNFIVWNDGTGDVLFFSVATGKVYAVYAADGTPYWTAPFIPSGFGSVSNRTGTLGAGANDGVLYYGFASVVGGNIVALDATDGTVIWDLASGAGLQGNTAWGGGVTIEQFQAGMAYDALNDHLFAVSTCSGDHPIAGTLYQLNGATGALVNPAQPVNGVSNAVTPVMDVATVLVPTRSIWVAPINDPDVLQVYRKSDLTFVFGTGWGLHSSDDYMVGDMVMTCEVEADDYIFFFSRRGVLHCVNGNTGEDVFNRRITDQAFGGAAGAIAEDTDGLVHLVFQDATGGMYDLTPQTSRARLNVLRGNVAETAARGIVPFGVNPSYPVEFTSIFSNGGCEDLTVEMTISATSNGAPSIPYRTVSADLGNNAVEMAQEMALNTSKFSTASSSVETPIYDENAVSYEKPVSMNPAALAPLGFINEAVLTATVAPDNEPVDITVLVDQAAVGRGVFPFFMSFTAYNDPDYWLDDPTLGPNPDPEVMLTFLGGCIMEFTDLNFGYDQANLQTVFNSGRLVENGIGGFTIDGDSKFFQGMYIFGVSPKRLAWTIVSWLEGSGETSTWNSWLPELIDGQCVPILTEAVAMGGYSADGTDYSATIMGNVVTYNSIDSVQNFYDPLEPDEWNHANFIAPFDNDSTMGLTIHHTTIGAYDYGLDTANWGDGILDDIGNATIEIFDFKERNGNAVPDWHFAAYYDWDIGARDTTNVHQDASLAYTYAANDPASTVGGSVKLPFNFCGNTADPNYLAPIIRGITLGQEQAMWGSLGSGGNDVYYLDSVWFYMTMPDSATSTEYVQVDYSANDQAGSYILAAHDFAPSETYRVAIAQFQFANYGGNNKNTARLKALAHTLNKWMGFGRGDVNNDNVIDMMDIIYTSNYVAGGPGPIPFEYLGDVNLDGVTTALDVTAIADYYFNEGGCFGGEWTM